MGLSTLLLKASSVVQSKVYRFIQRKAEEEDLSLIYPDLDFVSGLQALLLAICLEAAAVVGLAFLLPAPAVEVLELRKVSATQALVKPQECSNWTIVPPDKNSILVGNWLPGDIYTSTIVSPEQIQREVPSLVCSAPNTGSDAYVQLWGGDVSSSGSTQAYCESNSSGLRVVMSTGSLVRNCQLVLNHATTIFRKLQLSSTGVQEHPDLFGLLCYFNATSRTVSHKFMFKTNLHPGRLVVHLEIVLLCDGSQAILAGWNTSGGLPSVSALETHRGLCTLSAPNGACLESVVRRNLTNWHLDPPEVMMVRLGELDCHAGYGVFPPQELAAQCGTGVTPPYYDQFPQLQSNGNVLDFNLSTIRQLAEYLIMDPDTAPLFYDLTFNRIQCPGRTRYVSQEVLLNFDNATDLAKLVDISGSFGNAEVFLFSCSQTRPQAPLAIFSFHWPKISIIHWLAMAFLVHPSYIVFRRFRLRRNMQRLSVRVGAGVDTDCVEGRRISVLPAVEAASSLGSNAAAVPKPDRFQKRGSFSLVERSDKAASSHESHSAVAAVPKPDRFQKRGSFSIVERSDKDALPV